MRPSTLPTYTYYKSHDFHNRRERLLSMCFKLAATDIQGLKIAARDETVYELPLTGTRPQKGWKARMADFGDAAFGAHIPHTRTITKEQVEISKGYCGFQNRLYEMGIQIDNLETQTIKNKGNAGHTIAKMRLSRRPVDRYVSGYDR